MANQFFNDYQSINRNNLFNLQTIITKEGSKHQRSYQVLKVNLNEDIIQHALKIAELKSRFTMNFNQAEIARTQEEKKLSSFRGVLAETASHLLLESYLNPNIVDIKRFDIERTSFTYSSDEYDIKIVHNNKSYKIESRSSENYKHSLKEGLENLDIIGSYTNNKKVVEEPSDFYIRPLYQYDPVIGQQERSLDNYINMLEKEEIVLYLTAGTDLDSMVKYGKIKQMGQNNTQFRCLWMQHPTAKDIMQFITELQNKFS
jgi:hypothetical protein